MEVSTHFGLGVLAHFKPKKTDKIYKDFELSQVFTCQTVLIFRNTYILFRKNSTHFGLDVSAHVGVELLAHFGPKNQKKLEKFIKPFEPYQVLVHNLLWQNVSILP